jgi:hypothetical protein
MTRRTVQLRKMIEHTNLMLNAPDPVMLTPAEAKAWRLGAAILLESMLFDAAAYAGFSYTEKANVEHDEKGYARSIEDDSRRCYTIHPKLA